MPKFSLGENTRAALLASGSAAAQATLARHYATDNTDVDIPGGSPGERGAPFSAAKAQAWAEGTLPGGAGTKSAKEWASDTSTTLAAALDQTYVARLGLRDNMVVQEDVIVGSLPKADGTIQTSLGSGYYMLKMAGRPGQVIFTNGKCNVTGDGTYVVHCYDKSGATVATVAGTSGRGTVTLASNPTIVGFGMGFAVAADPVTTLGIRENRARRKLPDLAWFQEFFFGKNLIEDTSRFTANAALNYATGSLSTIAGYYTTQMVPVAGNLLPVRLNSGNLFSGSFGWCDYDEYGKFITGAAGSGTANTPYTPHADAFFIKTSFNSAVTPVANITLYVGNLPTIVRATSADIAAFGQGMNVRDHLSDPSQFVSGIVTKADGTTTSLGGTWGNTGLASCVPNEILAANYSTDPTGDGVYGWQFFDIKGTYVSSLSGVPAGVDVQVPPGCYQYRVICNIGTWPLGYMKIRSKSRPPGRRAALKWGNIGDSNAAKMGGLWQQRVTDLIGLPLVWQDARGGRMMSQAFEMYQVSGSPVAAGNPTTGVSTGGVINSTLAQAAGDGSVPVGKPQVNIPSGAWAPGMCYFTGYMSGTTLTVVSVLSGSLAAGATFIRSGLFQTVVGQLSGTAGGAGTYEVSNSTTLGSAGSPQKFITSNSWSTGNTLAQDLAALDVVTVCLGTNDAPLLANLGSLASTAGDGSYYGWLMWVFDGLRAAKRSLIIVPIIPQWGASGAMSGTIAGDAQRAFFQDRALPFCDLQRTSNVSAKSEASATFLQGDGIHWSQLGHMVAAGPRVAHVLEDCT